MRSSTSAAFCASVVSFMKMRGRADRSSVMYRRPSPLSVICCSRFRSASPMPTADTVMREARISWQSSAMPS
jgi:hypothetical protein